MNLPEDISAAAREIVERFAPGLAGTDRPRRLIALAVALQHAKLQTDCTRLVLMALDEAPDDAEVAARARAILGRGVPRWHIPMLHDDVRADAYARSLAAHIRPGMLVLDIGTGSGLLAILAAKAGADMVVACEQDPVLAVVATDIVRRNGLSDRIRVIAKHSRDLVVGKDLPRRADLLVSEILDGKVLGEGVLDTVAHAREHLLTTSAAAIPANAWVHVALGRADLKWRQPLSEVAGVDVSLINLVGGHAVSLRRQTHIDVLSSTATLFSIDLTGAPVAAPRFASAPVTAHSAGTATEILQWMSLDLGAGIHLDTGPDSRSSAWTIQAFHLFRALALTPGEQITIAAEHTRRSLLTWPVDTIPHTD